MDRTTKGLIAIIACATIWSSGGMLIKLVPWHPLVIAGGRSLLAALFLLAVMAVRAIKDKRAGRDRSAFEPRVDSATARARRMARWGAAAMNAATMLIFVAATKMTTAANAILLQYSAPIFAAILGWALIGEKPLRAHWIALGAVCVGLLVFFKDGLGGGAFAGDALAVVSGVTFGSYSVFMRMQKDGRPEISILYSHLVTAAIGLPFAFAAPPEFSFKAIAGIAALGFFQIGVTSLLFAYAIRRVSAVQTMLSAVVEPVLNPVWVLLATGERPSPAALLGGAIILVAVTLSSVSGIRGQALPGSGPRRR